MPLALHATDTVRMYQKPLIAVFLNILCARCQAVVRANMSSHGTGFMRFYARRLARDGARHSPSLTGRVVLAPVGPVHVAVYDRFT